ncbi:hypothetical protein D3C73_852970 [compost metagenome]
MIQAAGAQNNAGSTTRIKSGRPAAARSSDGRLDTAKLARWIRRFSPPGRAGTHSGARRTVTPRRTSFW